MTQSTVVATGVSGPGAAPHAEARGLRGSSCPAPNLVVHAETYSRAETRKARRLSLRSRIISSTPRLRAREMAGDCEASE